MFRPNCRAISRLIFEQVECTIDSAFNLRDFVLQELVKIIVVYYIKKLKIKIQMWYFYTISIKNRPSKIDGVVMGVYGGWDSFFQNYGG